MEIAGCEITLLVHQGRERNWVRALAHRLECSLGQRVALRTAPSSQASRLVPYETVDRMIYGSPEPDLAGLFSTTGLPSASGALEKQCLLIDTTDDELDPDIRDACAVVLTPLFDHEKGLRGLTACLARGEAPYLSMIATTAGAIREIFGTRITIPDRDSVPAFLNSLFARLVTLIDAAVGHLLLARPLPLTGPDPERGKLSVTPLYNISRRFRSLARSLAHRVVGPVVRTADWTIAFRRTNEKVTKGKDLDPGSFMFVPCDYGHFYADPMIFTHGGATWIFFENYDYAAKIGSLSCVNIPADGRAGKPVRVMAGTSHLSYPFIFAHQGVVFMIPETGAERRVELWRATRFPDRWELCSTLLTGVEAVDATVKYDPDRAIWWMFVSVAEPGGCTYDTLSIYYSAALRSGWKAHPLNPVKLDPSSSRPAGPIIEEGGIWLRPAQDCSHRYGGGLVWCQITELSPETFREEVVERWLPPSGFRGLHTYSRGDGWEALDLQRRRWRWSTA